jgi:hypothetical protein
MESDKFHSLNQHNDAVASIAPLRLLQPFVEYAVMKTFLLIPCIFSDVVIQIRKT